MQLLAAAAGKDSPDTAGHCLVTCAHSVLHKTYTCMSTAFPPHEPANTGCIGKTKCGCVLDVATALFFPLSCRSQLAWHILADAHNRWCP